MKDIGVYATLSSIHDILTKNNFINFVKVCFVKWKQELECLTLVKTVLFMAAKQEQKMAKIVRRIEVLISIFWMYAHFTCQHVAQQHLRL